MGIKFQNANNKNIKVGKRIIFPALNTVTDAGVFFEEYGGYYAGVNMIVDSVEYAIIVAPIEGNPITRNLVLDSNDIFVTSLFDGRKNTQDMINATGTFPAAEYCANLDINGFNDWHLPSQYEYEACYRYLKPSTTLNDSSLSTRTNTYTNPVLQSGDHSTTTPSQTSIPEFQEGNTEAFESIFHFSSSVTFESFYRTRLMSFDNGVYGNSGTGGTRPIRAVRWVEV